MYVILTNDSRVPNDVKDFDFEKYTLEEFTAKGEFTERDFYVDIACLTKDLYELFESYKDQLNITYFKWEDVNTKLDFNMTEDVVLCKVDKPVEPKIDEDIEKELVQPHRTKKQEVEDKKEVEEYKKEIEPQLEISDELDFVVDNVDLSQKKIDDTSMTSILSFDEETVGKKNNQPAKTIAFASSKGGTGKSTTCGLAVKNYAINHPNERIAVADFDIIDGQMGALIGKITPTITEYYKQYKSGNTDFSYLYNCKVKSENFGANVDFYLAMNMPLKKIIEDGDFWNTLFRELLMHYDVVFFDTGIDYLNILPITKIYKFVDRLIITTNTSVPSVKSTMRQLQTLGGVRKNLEFAPEDKILEKIMVVITRATKNKDLLKYIVKLFEPYAKVGAIFGTMEDMIERVSWYHEWDIIKNNEVLCKYLTKICDLNK